ncbi:hypothetical protein HN873_022794 [Arachis hypogaea]
MSPPLSFITEPGITAGIEVSRTQGDAFLVQDKLLGNNLFLISSFFPMMTRNGHFTSKFKRLVHRTVEKFPSIDRMLLLRVSIVVFFSLLAFLVFGIDFGLIWEKVKSMILGRWIRIHLSRLLWDVPLLFVLLFGFELDSFFYMRPDNDSPSSKDSTEVQVSSPLGEERDEGHGMANTHPSDSKQVSPSSGSGADSSFHSCSSSSTSNEVDVDSLFLTSSEVEFFKQSLRSLFKDPVACIKPSGYSFDSMFWGKKDVMGILYNDEKARNLVVERLFQSTLVDRVGCEEFLKALLQETWPNSNNAARGTPYHALYTIVEDYLQKKR